MTLTAKQEQLFRDIESEINTLSNLLKGAGSANQLNRLIVLAQDEYRKMNERVDALEADLNELIALTRKLQ